MPRPVRAFGRPRTRVVPTRWEAQHAPVLDTTRTGRCVIHAPATGAPVFDPDLGYSVTPEAEQLHAGTVRLVAVSSSDRQRILGDQQQSVTLYRAEINAAASRIPVGSVMTFTESNDTWLNASRLYVRHADLGTLRFSRVLFVALDATDNADHTPEEV